MNNTIKKLLICSSFFIMNNINGQNDSFGKSFYMGHSAIVVGNGLIEGFNHIEDKQCDDFALHSSIQFNAGSNFNAQDITKYYFFNNGIQLRVGQKASFAAATNIYNEYFLLPQTNDATETWAATLSSNPKMINMNADFRATIDFSNIKEGLYLEANFPISHTTWDLRLSENSIVNTTTAIQAGAIGTAAITAAPYTSIINAFKGDLTDGHVQKRLYGNINGVQKKTALGDAKVALGYHFIRHDNGHFGLALLGIFNSDNNSINDAKYLGMPVIGTAGRQCVGMRFDGAYHFYKKNNNSLIFAVRSDIAHVFNAIITRSYDITKYSTGSRYILAKEFTTAGVYNTNIVPIINFSTLRAKINMSLLYDLTLALRYTRKNWFADGGYQLAGHTKENHNGWIDTFTSTWYGGMVPDGITDVNTNTDTLATNVSINGAQSSNVAPTTANATIDTVLKQSDLNIPSGLSETTMNHRFFADLGYNIEHRWNPFITVGGGAEISPNNNAPYQWEAHIIGGVTF